MQKRLKISHLLTFRKTVGIVRPFFKKILVRSFQLRCERTLRHKKNGKPDPYNMKWTNFGGN